jgi:cell division protein ZipA
MEGYLRLILLAVAGAIVFFILFDAWYTHRQRKLRKAFFASKDVTDANHPDTVLGLPTLEPTMNLLPDVTDEPLLNPEPLLESDDGYQISLFEQLELQEIQPIKPKRPANLDDLLVITIAAKAGQQFSSYELLQCISAAGLEFGEMNIFHYYQLHREGRITLFSLASASEPGDFDLDRIGNFSCNGLTLFANLYETPDPVTAFELMLKSAEQLAEDLDGELRVDSRRKWNDMFAQQYREKALQYQVANLA